ncbi:hypothetical protein MASR1M60_17940 [Rhodocyclaceae bacterium]
MKWNGRYQVQADGSVVLTENAKNKTKSGARQSDIEVATGEKSAVQIGIERALPILRKAKSWQELHAGLAAVGLRFERDGSGAMIYVGDVAVKASAVDRQSSFPKLIKKLRAFESFNQEQKHEYYRHKAQEPHARRPEPLSQNRLRRLSKCDLARNGGNEKK